MSICVLDLTALNKVYNDWKETFLNQREKKLRHLNYFLREYYNIMFYILLGISTNTIIIEYLNNLTVLFDLFS